MVDEHTLAKIGVSCVNSVYNKWIWNDFVWSLFDKTLAIVLFIMRSLLHDLKGTGLF